MIVWLLVFFFNESATTEIYTYGHTLSLHDALPIAAAHHAGRRAQRSGLDEHRRGPALFHLDEEYGRRDGGHRLSEPADLARMTAAVAAVSDEIGRAHV